MEFNCKVNIVDAIMGAGKTQSIMNYINQSDEDEKFLVITPFLDEIDRYRKYCSCKNFKAPTFLKDDKDEKGSKFNDLKRLIGKGDNIVSNNYSISTDGLATALKDSASALVTANNDLNEAVSLTTAGNAITQDPSKVGAGLRTISLRLVGTEEAKQELSDLGEETDGMITTVSKLRDTIMDATKAASADGKGFDILDDNGNYKSTYEIMQGLADLYDDIVKKDKELGTNNLNLLLETIAGKNRSNIAASILQNGEMLKSVYEDAQNSEGSAEQELNSYLDSVDGKLQQLSNRAQEFWFKVIDSETIKNGIDLLTNLTKGATDFVDTIGILPTLLTGIGAGIAVKNVGEHYIVPVSI